MNMVWGAIFCLSSAHPGSRVAATRDLVQEDAVYLHKIPDRASYARLSGMSGRGWDDERGYP